MWGKIHDELRDWPSYLAVWCRRKHMFRWTPKFSHRWWNSHSCPTHSSVPIHITAHVYGANLSADARHRHEGSGLCESVRRWRRRTNLTAGYRHNFSYSMGSFVVVVVVVVVVVASLPPTIWHHFIHLPLAKSSWNYFVLFNHISVWFIERPVAQTFIPPPTPLIKCMVLFFSRCNQIWAQVLCAETTPVFQVAGQKAFMAMSQFKST